MSANSLSLVVTTAAELGNPALPQPGTQFRTLQVQGPCFLATSLRATTITDPTIRGMPFWHYRPAVLSSGADKGRGCGNEVVVDVEYVNPSGAQSGVTFDSGPDWFDFRFDAGQSESVYLPYSGTLYLRPQCLGSFLIDAMLYRPTKGMLIKPSEVRYHQYLPGTANAQVKVPNGCYGFTIFGQGISADLIQAQPANAVAIMPELPVEVTAGCQWLEYRPSAAQPLLIAWKSRIR